MYPKRTRWPHLVSFAAALAITLGTAGVAQAAVPAQDPGGTGAGLADCPLIAEGDETPCVTTLQTELNAVHDDYHLVPDGSFGPETRIAVLDFQGRNHLGADGLVGPETAGLLQQQYDQLSVATPTPAQPVESDSDTANGITTNCGTWTCSDYVSRAGTRQMLDLLNSDDNPADLLSETACVLAGGKKSRVCDVTDRAIEFGELMTRRTLEDAVHGHPPNGACFKRTYEKHTGITTYVSTNNGRFCLDG